MFCSKCGSQVADGAAFCGNCGAPVNAQPTPPPQQPQYDPNQYQYQAPQQPFAPQGQPYGAVPPVQAPALGMKWFKFLIYFLLFAIGILNIIGGITALTGGQYVVEGKDVSKAVYLLFPDLKTVDIIYGIACILLGVFQFYIRFQLAGYKTKAPSYITVMYIITAVVAAVYSFAVVGIVPDQIVGHDELIGQGIGSIVGAVVMLIVNKTYFDKRKNLFIN